MIQGKIVDETTHNGLPYAEVTISNITPKDSVYGVITNAAGSFKISKIPYGSYQLVVSFMGYANHKKEIMVNTPTLELETILLKEKSEKLSEVLVKTSKPSIQYKVDRQVINASSFPSASVAMDLLTNIPSLQVDVNDNLKYRGDGIFKVYINGHPVQNGTDKLRQISADLIDKIEIITNPSVVYGSEGTAGIIQVLLKKNRLQGYAINANSKVSTLGDANGYLSLDKKSEKWGWYFNATGGESVWSQLDVVKEQTVIHGLLSYSTNINQSEKNGQKNLYIEAGFNYDLTDKDYLDLTFTLNPIKTNQFNDDLGAVIAQKNSIIDTGLQEIESYLLKSNRITKYHYIGGNLNFSHYFNKDKTHKLSAYADVSSYLSPYTERQLDEKQFVSETERLGYYNYEKNEFVLNAKLEYNYPITDETTLDAGIEMDLDDIPEIGSTSGTFDADDNLIPFSNQRNEQRIDFMQNVYSGFLNIKSSWKKFEYQFGLRMEHTDTKSNYQYVSIDGENIFVPAQHNFSKFFPSLHLLYNLNDNTQWVANYTRRINRASYYALVPVVEYADITTYYTGNADIKPSYINAYEMGFKNTWNDKSFLSIQVFHRKTIDVIEYFNYADEEGKLINTPENVGDSYSTGSEFMGNFKCNVWWETNVSISLFMYKIHVNFMDDDYSKNQFNHNFKWNNTFNFLGDYSLRLNMDYNGHRFQPKVIQKVL
ncbi:TonB-dependent receptor-like protein [Mariniflexile fucanivorans]|uniref:TonB-dependent receptor-like protein n=1 Tax=Mariniflexile fucanivorans TaxID=264023 RepID=A0A4V2QDU7_9FLAO|nr:outer membrane beta-barrel family protein [Mariniflexile fucanivorans]TCL65627.1 TonB-dependent receptor-like protein [Mariniflexile fucanivorans]